MSQITERQLAILANHLCLSLNIEPLSNGLVLFVGAEDAENNAEALKEWVEGQIDSGNMRSAELAAELRQRLIGVLSDLDIACHGVI